MKPANSSVAVFTEPADDQQKIDAVSGIAIPSTDPPAYVTLAVLPVLVAPGIVPATYRSELEYGLSAKGHCISHEASPPGVNHYTREENQPLNIIVVKLTYVY